MQTTRISKLASVDTTTVVKHARRAAHGVRGAHTTLKTFVPTITAFISLLGAAALAAETLSGERAEAKARTKKVEKLHKTPDATTDDGADDDEADADEDEEEDGYVGYSFLGHAITLVRFAIVAVAMTLGVLLLAWLALAFAPMSTAIVLTALIVVSLWLAELLARKGA